MMGSAHFISDKRKAGARKHADKTFICVCGKRCRGNGGWSNHKRACAAWNEARSATRQQAR